jgi:hypothetical protein
MEITSVDVIEMITKVVNEAIEKERIYHKCQDITNNYILENFDKSAYTEDDLRMFQMFKDLGYFMGLSQGIVEVFKELTKGLKEIDG